MNNKKPKVIVIVGPTASGKSDLAVEIALFIKKNSKKFGFRGAEIISADSRQVYKYLDIGSNKITKKETKGIPHHLLSVASPKKTFSVARYQKLAQKTIKQIIKRKNIPIICGGTGLYIDSLIFGYKFPDVKPNAKLRNKLEKMTTSELFELLKSKDKKRAKNIDRYNRKRLIRALEIVMALKKVPKLEKEEQFDALWIGLKIDKATLKEKITKRLNLRIKKGLIAEVKKLRYKIGLSWKRLESFGMEYKYVSYFLQSKIDKQEMIEKIIKESLLYAKRQMTWFKRNQKISWIKDKKESLNLIEGFLKER
jgi:tRNA dimethylallyltransferase